MIRSVSTLAKITALVLFAALAFAAKVTSERLEQAEREPQNWLTYGGTYKAWRYSALDQVNRTNVRSLIPAWALQTGVIDGGLNCTPLVADGIMYVTSAWNRVFAVDAVTGDEIWHYYYPAPKKVTFYGPWNRGVALGHGLVFMGTMDNHLVALDAKTGREVWNVEIEDADQCGCNITSAPLVVKDMVITGVTGGDSAHRGYLDAYDAKTGRQVWRFWTIPAPGEPGHETWEGDSWKYGGAPTWMTGSYDPELNHIYWAVGNPAADFYGEDRSGDNLYTNSLIALDADTGKLKWYNQQIPYDVWDYDAAFECVLVDLEHKGKKRKLLLNPNKGGYTWVVDRTNGEFINAWPVAESNNWVERIDENGKLIGRKEPKVGVPSLFCPSAGGGRQWNQGAYSPKTGWFYSTGIEWCMMMTTRPEEPRPGQPYFGGDLVMVKPPNVEAGGHLSAYDPISGEIRWRHKTKYPMFASQLATAGDLVFTGDIEGRFIALDADTGETLWSFRTGSGHRGSSITYAVNGKQFVATPSGWGSAVVGAVGELWPETKDFPRGSALFVFALPEEE